MNASRESFGGRQQSLLRALGASAVIGNLHQPSLSPDEKTNS
jgi:hypothetical protein